MRYFEGEYVDTTFYSAKQKATCLERWENCLRVLLGLTRHERRKHFSMRTWGQKTACGTVACAAGFCGLDPWFRRRGLKLDLEDENLTIDPDEFFIYGAQRIFYNEGTHAKVVARVRALIKEIKGMPVAKAETA